MLNTLCDVFPHYRNEAAEMDKSLPPTSRLSPAATTKKKRKNAKVSQEILWQKEFTVFDINHSKPIVKSADDGTVATELEFLKMFISQDFMNEISNQTKLYAQQKNVSLNVTKNEFWVIFGAFLLSGYVKYPKKKRLYWSKEEDSPSILSQLADAGSLKAYFTIFILMTIRESIPTIAFASSDLF